MGYTFEPNRRYAKAFGSNLRISRKNAVLICRVIRKKKLKVAKRLLEDLVAKRRDLDGRYYSKTVPEILNLLKSCEKNADFQNLSKENLFVHASAHHGSIARRRRRKSGFGSRMKMTNVEIFLIERGKLSIPDPAKKKERAKTEHKSEHKADGKEVKHETKHGGHHKEKQEN